MTVYFHPRPGCGYDQWVAALGVASNFVGADFRERAIVIVQRGNALDCSFTYCTYAFGIPETALELANTLVFAFSASLIAVDIVPAGSSRIPSLGKN